MNAWIYHRSCAGNSTLKDNYISNPMLDILRKNIRRYKPQKVINYSLFSVMHIHKQYSWSSACDYFDTTSTLAVTTLWLKSMFFLLTIFTLLMTMDFSSLDTLLDVNVPMVPSECSCVYFTLLLVPCWRITSIVTPSLNLNVQLVTHLRMMMEKNCHGCIFRHYCCDFSEDVSH